MAQFDRLNCRVRHGSLTRYERKGLSRRAECVECPRPILQKLYSVLVLLIFFICLFLVHMAIAAAAEEQIEPAQFVQIKVGPARPGAASRAI